jgi:hypothetical protein
MTAWKLSVAAQKPPGPGRPNLGDLASRQRFSEAIAIAGAKVTPIRQVIALEAAGVATI